MASEIKNAKDGLMALILAISGIAAVSDYPLDEQFELPVAMGIFTGRDARNSAISGMGNSSSFEGFITVTVLVSSLQTSEAFDLLDEFMEPIGTNSIEAAIDADHTWGGNVDYGKLVNITRPGWRSAIETEDGPVFYVMADFNFVFGKKVST